MCPHRVKNWLLIWYMPVTIWPRECRKTDDIFSFFRWCLFPPSLVVPALFSLLLPLIRYCAYFLFHRAPVSPLLHLPLCNSPPPFPPFSNVLLESDSIFAPAVLLWRGHISWPYPREARTRDAEAAKEKGRKRAGWQIGITGGNTGAFNMQLPSTLPGGKTSRKKKNLSARTRAHLIRARVPTTPSCVSRWQLVLAQATRSIFKVPEILQRDVLIEALP